MKKYVWIVIAIVLFFVGLIVAYTLGPVDQGAAGGATPNAEQSH